MKWLLGVLGAITAFLGFRNLQLKNEKLKRDKAEAEAETKTVKKVAKVRANSKKKADKKVKDAVNTAKSGIRTHFE